MKKRIKVKLCASQSRFVLQSHHASHRHYDFRLEKFGTLKSWAVPKGLPTKVGEKRLAIQTPNHPLSYISFEGRIPMGEYGAGTVSIADYGCYEPKIWNEHKIEFILHGKKYKGKYIMVAFGRYGQWLIIKGND